MEGNECYTYTLLKGCHGPSHFNTMWAGAGVSRIIRDRDFILRTVRVCFPNGIHVLLVRSVPLEETMARDPGAATGMVRYVLGHGQVGTWPCAAAGCAGRLASLSLEADTRVASGCWLPSCRGACLQLGSTWAMRRERQLLQCCSFCRVHDDIKLVYVLQGPHVGLWLRGVSNQEWLLHERHAAGGSQGMQVQQR
jgi:hypothetical protein